MKLTNDNVSRKEIATNVGAALNISLVNHEDELIKFLNITSESNNDHRIKVMIESNKTENLINNYDLLNAYRYRLDEWFDYWMKTNAKTEITDICSNISKITGLSMKYKLYVLDADLYPILIKIATMSSANQPDIGGECLRALANSVCNKDERIVNELIKHGISGAVSCV